MDKDIKEMLAEEIKAEILDLEKFEPGSKEKSEAIDSLAVLYKLRIEETKTGLEFNEKIGVRKCEEKIKKDQLAEQVKDRYFRVGIEAAGVILPLIFYAVWMTKGFKFEETGTFTSATFRGLFSRFKPTAK